jgi:23S rRNA (cytosine1962-C5)-methyltransferase
VENGLRFMVDLVHGQKGGLFLDQRENRARLADLCASKRVLNLFGYTGAFSVYAAAAGATFTDTVDVAAPAMVAARTNFALNHLDLERAAFHPEDAFTFLERAISNKATWDVVITDPPSFAPNQRSLDTALAAYRRLHALACKVVVPGGLLAAASCSSHVNRKMFLDTVINGAAAAGKRFELEHYAGAGFDHPVIASFPEGDYLKFALGRVVDVSRTTLPG